MKKAAIGLIAIVCLGWFAAPANASVIIASDLQGWVTDSGNGNSGGNGNNTFTGNEFGGRFNSWADFVLPILSGQTVISATLELTTENFPGGNPPYDVGIFDVSTPLAAFLTNTSDVAGYTDLRTGTSYGTALGMTNGTSSILLSAQAVADINAALGGNFLLGFTNETLNAIPSDPGDDLGIYTNGQLSDHPVLVLETAAVPEPVSLLLVGTGAAALIARRRAQKSDRS